MKNIVFFFGLLLALQSSQAAASAAAGRFQFVSGEVKITSPAGKDRIARKGDEIKEGETITSASSASAQVKMKDDGMIIVRPETKLRITTYQYNGKTDGSERSLISLIQGGFRAITGMIGRVNKDNYKVETPTATIGIRGTDHEPMFIPNPVAGHKALIEPGTYDKVNSGAAILSTARGMVVINPNHAGFVPNLVNAAPTLLREIPKFYLPPGKDEPAIVPGAALQPGGAQQTGSTGNAGTTTRLSTTTLVVKPALSTTLAPATLQTDTLTTKSTTLQTAPLATTTIAPAVTKTAPTTIIAPTTSVIAPKTTAIIAPAPATVAPATTLQLAPVTTKSITTTISPTVSDRRLKRNIKRIGTHRLGIGIYEYDYVWGEHATGVMADEVKQVMPEAVIRGEDGYDRVDYTRLK